MSGERTRFFAWITKYALTTGIKGAAVEDRFDISPTMVSEVEGKYHTCYHGNDWHRTKSAALARARTMRDAKIKNLQKQIAKLKAMTFWEDR